jgi:hypothetical protein
VNWAILRPELLPRQICVEQVSRASGQWITETRLNGDQTNQGRQLLMDPRRQRIYRVRLYSIIPDERH